MMTDRIIVLDGSEYQWYSKPRQGVSYYTSDEMYVRDRITFVNRETDEYSHWVIVHKYAYNKDGKVWIDYILAPWNESAVYRCFHCGGELHWESDNQEIGLDEKEYLCHYMHCDSCGADVTYMVPL